MGKLRKATSVSKLEETPEVIDAKEVKRAEGVINRLDGYLDNLEESNKNIVDALEQLTTRELTDAERADLSKMLNTNLKYTGSISKRLKRMN